jgi:serine/threonine protein kinase
MLPDGLELLRRIGAGSSSVVYLARRGETLLAAKFCSARCFETELSAFEALGEHPNILSLRGHFATPRVRALLFEVMDATLARRLGEAGGALPAHKAFSLAAQVASALVRLSDVHLVHGDVRPANVLLSVADVAKLADFGQSYWSPYAWPRDIWSLGRLLAELLPSDTAPPTDAGLVARLCAHMPSRRPTAARALTLLVRAGACAARQMRDSLKGTKGGVETSLAIEGL